jgi:hypothetical protein
LKAVVRKKRESIIREATTHNRNGFLLGARSWSGKASLLDSMEKNTQNKKKKET